MSTHAAPIHAKGQAGACPACALRLGRPGDALEREADRVADAVMSAAPGRPQASSHRSAQHEGIPVRPTPAAPQVAATASGAARVQRAPTSAVSHASNAQADGLAPQLVGDAIQGPGRPLDAGLRAWFEPRLGHNLGQVRIHTGEQPERAAAAVGARAYTVGNHIAFGAGQYAPSQAAGRRLLAHELAHTVQQGGDASLVQRDLIFGSGYANPFAGRPAAEAAAAQKSPREWFPSSVDFAETATLSGGGRGLSTLAGLLNDIRGKAVGSISDIDLIGHANADLFALGGTITRDSVTGSQGGTIGATQLAAVQNDIDGLRDRFARGAHITLYGCNSGASGTLLQAISTAFKVCARGFKDPISWCLGWRTGPIVINSRGRTLINPADNTPCDAYNGSLYNLSTDTEDCSGTKPKVPDVKLPDRKPSVPQVPQ